ncbi:MAG TPA: hypothetical protein PK874_04930 [Desulfobacteraceae bacterium]|nr:hypothetical protein [Desulfobacteraceae bacterium]HPJ68949.1 hypothetical protein [Desulfobacteraceae bacterium]HPQ29727.1 hypothetical protein [Desulfobacteraceae bacterium]
MNYPAAEQRGILKSIERPKGQRLVRRVYGGLVRRVYGGLVRPWRIKQK